jgi:hypothetical protein
MQGISNQSSCNIESYPSKFNSTLQNSSLGDGLLLKILCHLANFWLSLSSSYAQFAKLQSCSFISSLINIYSAFMLPLSAIVKFWFGSTDHTSIDI